MASRTSPAKKWALSTSFSRALAIASAIAVLDQLEPPHLGRARRHQQPDRADPAVQVDTRDRCRPAARSRWPARRAARPSRCWSGRRRSRRSAPASRRSPPPDGRCRPRARSRRPAWSRPRCRSGSTAGRRRSAAASTSPARSSSPGRGHQPDLELTACAWPLADHQVAQEPLAGCGGRRRSGPAARHHSTTRSRAALAGSEASRQSVTSTISSQRPGAWKPHTSRPSASVPNEYSSLLR